MTDDMLGDHVGCQAAFETADAARRFAEARLERLKAHINALGHEMDRVGGNTPVQSLDNKTLGGAVRNLLTEKPWT